MAKINKFSNIYDKDGNLIRKVNEKQADWISTPSKK